MSRFSAEERSDALPALARELVKPAVLIATYDTASALAAKAATTTIPIVFSIGADAIKIGLVASLARPGGNVTAGERGRFKSRLSTGQSQS